MTVTSDPLLALPDLPFDRPVGPDSGTDRREVRRTLPDGPAGVSELATALGMPANHAALAAWAIVLATYSRRPVLQLGIASQNRLVELEVDAPADDPFSSVARRVSEALGACPEQSKPCAAVFDLDGGDGGAHPAGPDTSFVLGLHCGAGEDVLVAGYDPARFDESTAGRMLDHVATVLSAAATSGGDVHIGDIALVTCDELEQLARWNSTQVSFVGRGNRMTSIFRDRAAPDPDSIALDVSGRLISHRELAVLIRRVADELLALGVGPGSLVGVLCERSAALIAAVHGISSAGAAYVPLDHEQPILRIEHMVRETGMPVVLCQRRFRELVAACDVAVVDLDELMTEDVERADAVPMLPDVSPDDLAYVIYTSGSTGRPKGVANAHHGVVNRLLWMQDRFPLDEADVVLHKTPFTFDVSVWELFWPLQVGARLVVAEPWGHRDPAYLVETIVRCGVTTVHFVPSMLRLFLEHPAAASCVSLRRVICSGEALTRDVQRRFFEVLPGSELHNLYGPTEAAIDVTAWQCHVDDDIPVVPIGAPIANTQIHIVDDRLRPVPIGTPGELHIGGVQVAVGYVNRAELTAERFIPDPFNPPGRLYRTGDLGRWLPSGQIDFLGRMDEQVKVRGQRVELGEIESVLREHPAVLGAAVTVDHSRSEARLVAHVRWSGEPTPEAALRAFLGDRLPSHMIPIRFVPHYALPLTSSGKIDRKALAEHSLEPEGRPMGLAGENELERFLVTLWCSVLGRPVIGRSDRVFDLGASSLDAAAFVNELQRELGEFIYVVTVFLAPTVAEYAAFLVRDYPAAVGRRFGGMSDTMRAPVAVDEAALTAMSEIVPRFGPHASWRMGKRNASAIFILSPPRSGTTLLRVMLAVIPACSPRRSCSSSGSTTSLNAVPRWTVASVRGGRAPSGRSWTSTGVTPLHPPG